MAATKLIEIAFTEGQRVKRGDVLARIDPRLFQAAVDQAFGRIGQDEANLMAAEKDLARAKTLVAKNFETQKVVDQLQGKVGALKAAIAADEAAMEGARTQLDYARLLGPRSRRGRGAAMTRSAGRPESGRRQVRRRAA